MERSGLVAADPSGLFEKSAELLWKEEFAMSRILSWSAVAWGLAMAVFAPHPGSAATNISSQTSSTTPALGALVELSPTLQPPIIGSFSFAVAGGANSSVITPDMKYMYVLVNTYQIGQGTLTSGSNKILTYRINGDGTLTATGSPEAGQDTTGTSLYLASQGFTLLTINSDGSSASANTAPFQVFQIGGDGSLSPIPNSIQVPAAQTVLSTGAMGSAAADGSGQYFYAALVDNDPNDSGYLTSSVVYAFKIAASGSLSNVSVFNFTPPEQPDYIFNILTSEKFLYIFGISNVYIAAVGSDGVAQPPANPTPYNSDPNFSGYASFGMQISSDAKHFYAVDSTDGSLSTLGICHYPINGDGIIQFPSMDCQNIFSNVPSGESFGAYGVYISPDNNFLYSLFQTEVGAQFGITCSASMYAYAMNSDGSLSSLKFALNPPFNSLPIGNNFCSHAFIAGAPDGSHLYAFGETGNSEGASNAIVPFHINKGLTSTVFTITPLVAHIRELELPQGVERSLMAKLLPAQHNLDAGHLEAACGSLGAFISTVDAQNRKKFDAAEAAKLITEATAISESVGCRRTVR
jgi:hypothetical protein